MSGPECPRDSTGGKPLFVTGYSGMRETGVLPADTDVDQLATGTLAALQGGLLLAQMHRSTVPLEAALDTVIAHVQHLTQQRDN